MVIDARAKSCSTELFFDSDLIIPQIYSDVKFKIEFSSINLEKYENIGNFPAYQLITYAAIHQIYPFRIHYRNINVKKQH